MIKQIILDCAGVIAVFDFAAVMTEVSGDPALGEMLVERLWQKDSPWLAYDRGLFTKQEMTEQLSRYFPEIPIETIKAFMDRWTASMVPIPGMETIVQELHEAGYPCYLLSNFNEQFEELRAHHANIRELDGEVVSYNIDMLKPSREIFDYTAERFRLDPAETLFVDDTPVNVEGAIAAGFQAYHFTDAVSFRRMLRERNILRS